MQKQQHGAIGLAAGRQAVGSLEGRYRRAGALAEHAVGLPLIIAQIAQGALHGAHVLAGAAAFERLGGVTLGDGEQIIPLGERVVARKCLQGGRVQTAGDLQIVGDLKIAHGGAHVARLLAQIAQLGQPRRGVHGLRRRREGAQRQGERRKHTDRSFHHTNLKCAFST